MGSHVGVVSQSPRFGISSPDRTRMAVVLPMPFGPRMPVAAPSLGTGSLNRRKPFLPYWCTRSPARASGKPMMRMASKGHLLTQMPHPMHSSSEMTGLPFSGSILMVSTTPERTGGQKRMHSCWHFFGWHRSARRVAIRTRFPQAVRFQAFDGWLGLAKRWRGAWHPASARPGRGAADGADDAAIPRMPHAADWRFPRFCRPRALGARGPVNRLRRRRRARPQASHLVARAEG